MTSFFIRIRIRFFAAAALLSTVGAGFACSEATDGLLPPDDGVDASDDDAGAADSGKPKATKSPASPADAATGSTSVVLINELSADNDWVEVVNSGAADVDLGGWHVADLDKSTNGPKLDEAAAFVSGSVLPAGAYGLVQAGGLDGGKPCPGASAICVHAEFGIGKSGETIFLVDKSSAVVGTVVYPANGAGSGQTWGRMPSGDPNGAFQATSATPGAANGP
jgi:hypothetical protein